MAERRPDARGTPPELKLVDSRGKTPPELPPLVITQGADMYNTPRPKVQWLVEGLIPRGSIFCLNGLGGTFKSWTMTTLGAAVAAGGRLMGRFNCPVDVQNTVLFVQLEETHEEAARKYQFVLRGLALQPEQIQNLLMGYVVGQPFRVDDGRRFDQMKILIDGFQPDLVMWDSARKMKRGTENDSEWADELTFRLKELQAIYPSAHGLVHHWRKKSGDKALDDPGERGRGSSALRDAVDVWLPVEENVGGFLTMIHHKHRSGPKHPSFNYAVRIDDGDGRASLEYIGVVTGDESGPGIPSRLLEVLQSARGRVWTQPELVRELVGVASPDQVRRALDSLEHHRHIIRESSRGGKPVRVWLQTDLIPGDLPTLPSNPAEPSTKMRGVENSLPTNDLELTQQPSSD